MWCPHAVSTMMGISRVLRISARRHQFDAIHFARQQDRGDRDCRVRGQTQRIVRVWYAGQAIAFVREQIRIHAARAGVGLDQQHQGWRGVNERIAEVRACAETMTVK
jgi:hypothetical protein